ncbi:glycosyltransferase, partial [Klebsiella pneumoniae]|nr:glycosyltransferase [Klebsiella pneumoniae]
MDISVIIPCYNREASIQGAVLSVLNQVGNHNICLLYTSDAADDG